MKDSIKVEVSNDGDYIGIRTFDWTHGARGRFLIAKRTLVNALFEPEHQATLEQDCGSFAEIWREGEDLMIRIAWLSEAYNGEVWGFRQKIMITKPILHQILTETGKIKYLCQLRPKPATINTNYAGRTIRRIMTDKFKHRAFVKAMRDCFRWPGEVVTLYDDGGDDFYFTTKSGFPKNGGLILSHGTVEGGYAYVRYSVHT